MLLFFLSADIYNFCEGFRVCLWTRSDHGIDFFTTCSQKQTIHLYSIFELDEILAGWYHTLFLK